jgi:hypothetical protein
MFGRSIYPVVKSQYFNIRQQRYVQIYMTPKLSAECLALWLQNHRPLKREGVLVLEGEIQVVTDSQPSQMGGSV